MEQFEKGDLIKVKDVEMIKMVVGGLSSIFSADTKELVSLLDCYYFDSNNKLHVYQLHSKCLEKISDTESFSDDIKTNDKVRLKSIFLDKHPTLSV